jgi:hypothetical protein
VQVNAHIYDSRAAARRCDKLRLKAGQKLLEMRHRVEAGEAGDVTWWEWFGQWSGLNGTVPCLLRSRKDCERLMRIAGADDPEAALEDERAKAREGMRRLRGTNKPMLAPTEPDETADDDVVERDRKECIALFNEAERADREKAQWLLDHPAYRAAADGNDPADDDGDPTDNVLKESDPVALAIRCIEMMDRQQLDRLQTVIDEYRLQLDRRRKSN